jgi:hypothetical protein
MSAVSHRSRDKESFWRSHLARQSTSGESIRGYCRIRKLSEALFHFWRREIARRDHEKSVSLRSENPGLIAVEIVGAPLPESATSLMEIECPGGPVIRVREGASLEVLQRVMKACWMTQAECGPAAPEAVRSC